MMKYIFTATLLTPFLAVSGMAQTMDQHVYQGGPKTAVPHAARSSTSPREAYGMELPVVSPRARRSHIYSGGPQTVVPHSY